MENFDCSICLKVLNNPVQCKKCSNNFCEECVQNLKQCPMCRSSPFEYTENIWLKRTISELEFPCPNGCGQMFKNKSEFDKHCLECKYIKCSLCQYKGNEDMLWAHLISNHRKDILSRFTESLSVSTPQISSLNITNKKEGLYPNDRKTTDSKMSNSNKIYDNKIYDNNDNYKPYPTPKNEINDQNEINNQNNQKYCYTNRQRAVTIKKPTNDNPLFNNLNNNNNQNVINNNNDNNSSYLVNQYPNFESNKNYFNNNKKIEINKKLYRVNSARKANNQFEFKAGFKEEENHIKSKLTLPMKNEYVNPFFNFSSEKGDNNNSYYINNDNNTNNNKIFYCNSKNSDIPCNCCIDHICRQGNCMCVSCMRKNIKNLNLTQGELINKAGRIAKLEKGDYYCGCEFESVFVNVIGRKFVDKKICRYCTQCNDCKILKQFMKKYLPAEIYKIITSN